MQGLSERGSYRVKRETEKLEVQRSWNIRILAHQRGVTSPKGIRKDQALRMRSCLGVNPTLDPPLHSLKPSLRHPGRPEGENLPSNEEDTGSTPGLVSSELEELRSTCDRIAIVSGGRISGILPASSPVEEFGKLMLSNVV